MTTISAQPQQLAVRVGGIAPTARADAVPARAALVAAVAAVAAVPPITALHLRAGPTMEPAGWTISDYAVGVRDGIALYGMTAGLLATGAAALASALRCRPGTAVVRLLLQVWAVAAVMTAAFPTNVRGTPETVSSTIHLIAGAVVFAVLPAVGFMLSRSRDGVSRSGWLRWTSVVAGALSGALILNRLPGVVGMPELMLPPGILQRAAGALLILLLTVLALTPCPSAAGSHAQPAAHPGHRVAGPVALRAWCAGSAERASRPPANAPVPAPAPFPPTVFPWSPASP